MKNTLWQSFVLLAVWAAHPAFAQPEIQGVLNSASMQPGVAPGSLVAIPGANLAAAEAFALWTPWPTGLAGTVVKVGDIEAPLYFVSPGLIYAQVPFEASADRFGQVAVTVTTADGASKPFRLGLLPLAPGVFTVSRDGRGRAAVWDADGQPIDAVGMDDTIVVYATGLGATDPPGISGSAGDPGTPRNLVQLPEVLIGEQPATVLSAALASGSAGIYALTLQVQGNATDRLVVRSAGYTHVTDLPLRAGQRNVANASGAIQPLFPVELDPKDGCYNVTVSPMLTAARFFVKFDILQSAGPFSVAAVGEAGSSVIRFDPASGTYEGTATVPIGPTRAGDFNGTEITAVDLASGFPLPGNRMPASRIDPWTLQATRSLPMPNVAVPGSATGLFKFQGKAPAGSTFTFDDPGSAAFGAFLALPWPASVGPTRATTFRLYVDGKLIASREVTYHLVNGCPDNGY